MSADTMTIINLGWGVQSWTMAAMSALGELPRVAFAIHADTTWEMEATYSFAEKWSEWLAKKEIRVVTVCDEETNRRIIDNSNQTYAPLYTISLEGGRRGQLLRSCTERWKIRPIRRFLTEELGRRNLSKQPGTVECWLGITTDEWYRARGSDVKWIKNSFPLLDLKMSRQDCLNWLDTHNLPAPQKSKCKFCPYTSPASWRNQKRANGADWQIAVEADRAIRHKRDGYLSFMSDERIPLADIKIPDDYGLRQATLFDEIDNDECVSGYCFL
jgi:hypothetical protein